MKLFLGFGSRDLKRLRFLVIALCIQACLTFAPARAQDAPAIQGTVTDRTTGLPISNVAVYGGCTWGNLIRLCTPVTTTDGNGNYSITAAQLNNTGSGTLYFQAAQYYIGQAAYVITAPPTTVNSTLLPGGTVIQGTVTDSNTAAGIVGAAIQFSTNAQTTYSDVIYTTTGSGGAYTVDSSQFYEGAASQGTLTVTSVSITATAYFTYSNNTTVAITTPYPSIQNFSMVPASGVAIQGTVTDRTTGLPISNVAVYGGCTWGNLIRLCTPVTTTDGNGNYSITAAQLNNTGSGTLYFQAAQYYIGQAAYVITASPTTVNSTLLPGGTVIQGTVTDSNTAAGIVGAAIQFSTNAQTTYSDVIYTTTGSGGAYTVDSSQFYEGAASQGTLTVTSVSITATAYFTYSNNTTVAITTPYP